MPERPRYDDYDDYDDEGARASDPGFGAALHFKGAATGEPYRGGERALGYALSAHAGLRLTFAGRPLPELAAEVSPFVEAVPEVFGRRVYSAERSRHHDLARSGLLVLTTWDGNPTPVALTGALAFQPRAGKVVGASFAVGLAY